MHPNDSDRGQFDALLSDLAALQAQRAGSTMAKALPPSPRRLVPFTAYPEAVRKADPRTVRADLARNTAELAALEREVRAMAAPPKMESVGERRARLRAGVSDLLDRAMRRFAAGQMTAVQVARVEAQANRMLAGIEASFTLRRGAA